MPSTRPVRKIKLIARKLLLDSSKMCFRCERSEPGEIINELFHFFQVYGRKSGCLALFPFCMRLHTKQRFGLSRIHIIAFPGIKQKEF